MKRNKSKKKTENKRECLISTSLVKNWLKQDQRVEIINKKFKNIKFQ